MAKLKDAFARCALDTLLDFVGENPQLTFEELFNLIERFPELGDLPLERLLEVIPAADPLDSGEESDEIQTKGRRSSVLRGGTKKGRTRAQARALADEEDEFEEVEVESAPEEKKSSMEVLEEWDLSALEKVVLDSPADGEFEDLEVGNASKLPKRRLTSKQMALALGDYEFEEPASKARPSMPGKYDHFMAAEKRELPSGRGRETLVIIDGRVRKAMEALGGETLTLQQIHELVGGTENQVRGALKRLISRGVVNDSGSRKGKRYHLS